MAFTFDDVEDCDCNECRHLHDPVDPERCPWCGEDVTMQNGLEGHMSEPCAAYLQEAYGVTPE